MAKLYTITLKYYRYAIARFLPILKKKRDDTFTPEKKDKLNEWVEMYADIATKIDKHNLKMEDPNRFYDGEPDEIEIELSSSNIEHFSRLTLRLLNEWKADLNKIENKEYRTDKDKRLLQKLSQLIWPLEAQFNNSSTQFYKYKDKGIIKFPWEDQVTNSLHLTENSIHSDKHKLIERIKEIMINVSTGKADIDSNNDEYKSINSKLQEIFVHEGIENPNEFTDLWEYYAYWKQNLTTYGSRRLFVIQLYKDNTQKPILKHFGWTYIHKQRLTELESLKENGRYDLTKLICYCEELNIAFANKSYLSTAMLVRSIMNHVAPVFGFNEFKQVVANYKCPKSTKDTLNNLENSSRKIADSVLHNLIDKNIVLPNSNQVDFSNDVDVLLAEVCKLLKT